MDRIFIDANIWLDFYDGQLSKYKELIKSLESLKAHLFVPKQIVDEIERNKAGVYLRSVFQKTTSTQFDGKMPPLSDELSNWNKNLDDLKQGHKALVAERKAIVTAHVKHICDGVDGVSIGFGEIFSDVCEATKDQLTQARLRREFGNPPGKAEDPLGDQLCWEQFLGVLQRGDRIWLVTNDLDYLVSYEGSLFLNPTLRNDLKIKVGDDPQVFCFDKLPVALKHFNDNKAEDEDFDIPSDDELVAIEEEFISAKRTDPRTMFGALGGLHDPAMGTGSFLTGAFRGIPPFPNPNIRYSTLLGNQYPQECPHCGVSLGGRGWVARDSGVGVRTCQTECRECGTWVDSKVPWD